MVTVEAGTSTIALNCPADIAVTAAAGATSAIVTYQNPLGNTTCATSGVTLALLNGLESGAAFPIGTTIVEYSGTDACGTINICSFTVTVNAVAVESELSCPADIIETVNSPTETVTISWPNPEGSTNCSAGGFVFTQTAGPASGSPFGVGTTTITCLLYTSPSPRDRTRSRMPSSA